MPKIYGYAVEYICNTPDENDNFDNGERVAGCIFVEIPKEIIKQLNAKYYGLGTNSQQFGWNNMLDELSLVYPNDFPDEFESLQFQGYYPIYSKTEWESFKSTHAN